MSRFWREHKKTVLLAVVVASVVLVGAGDVVVNGTSAPKSVTQAAAAQAALQVGGLPVT